jgi:MFS family permease
MKGNSRVLVAMLVANAISVAGTRLSAMAIPWLVLTTTGSATKTGLVVAFELTPMVITKALAGPLIDRLGAYRMSITADIASAVLVTLVPVLHLAGMLNFPALLGLVALAGIARGPSDTSKGTLAPDVADAIGAPLERVTGLVSTAERLAMIITPALGGALIGLIGPVNALLVDAASFLVCAAGIAWFCPNVSHPAAGEPEPYWQQLHAGWRFLSRDPLMRAMVTMVSVTNLIDTAYASVLLPIWIHDHGYGPAELGMIGSAFSLTAAIAAAVAAAVGNRLPRRLVYLAGFFLAGIPRFVVLAAGAPMWVIVGVGALGGFGAGVINPILNAIFVERIPRELLGRVSSLAESLSWAGMPIGTTVMGAAIAATGLFPVLIVAGTVYLVTTVLPGRLPQWAEMNTPKEPAPAPARS